MSDWDAIVVGAGIHGLCTAFWLRQAGVRKLAVFEQYAAEHSHGSSHGRSRITRSSYGERRFVDLAQAAHRVGWPALEAAVGTTLRQATPGLFFGPAAGPFADYLAATSAGGAEVEPIDVATARRLAPLLAIPDHDAVLLDHTAAVLLASRTMRALQSWLYHQGVALHWVTPVRHVAAAEGGLRLETSFGAQRTRTAVLATGPWLPKLLGPQPEQRVVRQHVGYFEVDAPAAALAPGAFPVWARVGATAEDFVYGLPTIGTQGLKVARHDTTGNAVDPDDAASLPPPDTLLALARHHLTTPVRRLRTQESCLYTMAPAHQLEIVVPAALPHTVAFKACSGHAFKFAPELGRQAATQVLAWLDRATP